MSQWTPKRRTDPLDLLDVGSMLTEAEKAILATVRQVCDDLVEPYVVQRSAFR